VVGVQLQRSPGGSQPLLGSRGSQVPTRCLGDHPGQPGAAHGQQRVRVGVAFQDRQVGHDELADQRACRQQLTDQVLEAPLVGGGLLGESVAGTHAAVQRRPGRVRQLKGMQPGGVDQRRPGQGVGVDAVGLGVARQEPAQVMSLSGADPVHGVAAAPEEHRDRQPRRPGRLHHHLQAGGRCRPGQRGPLHLTKTVEGRDRLASAHGAAPAIKHPHGVGAGDPQVDPDQPSVVHACSSRVVICCSGCPDGRRLSATTVPRWLSPTTAPTHVLQPAPVQADRATSLIRDIRGQTEGGNQGNEARRVRASLRAALNATPGPTGMLMQPWDFGVDQAPQSLT
jgi:hypothetical protein